MAISSPQSVAPLTPVQSPPRRSKLKQAVLLLLIAFVVSEVISRFIIGLGDPPLYMADSTMEYLLQPSRTYFRFHKRFSVNQFSMRADDFPPQKSAPNEFRVLVVGDSIVYGGARIDQSEIDTEILKRKLQEQLGRSVVVGNASAKSWGPPNELAYLKHFGTLDADLIVLELSSHDYADAPTFVPVVGVSAEYPDKKPRLALLDLIETYLLPRYFHRKATPEGIDKTLLDRTPSDLEIAQCREAERQFFSFAREHGAKVVLVQHLSRPELSGKYQRGYYANQEVAKEENVPYVDDADELRALSNSGRSPFYEGDALHLNKEGQVGLAHALQRGVDAALFSGHQMSLAK
jgi:GDSL-like Lipase/Acylhydrolase family